MAGRRKMGSKDMVMTMVIVLAVVGLIAVYGQNVSFAPGGQAAAGPVPTANVVGGFSHAKATMDFAITVPGNVPESWHPNSLSVSDPEVSNDGISQVGTLKAVRGGWVTAKDTFIQLVEAAGNISQVLTSEFGQTRQVTGTVEAGGASWSVTTGVRSEVAWVRTVASPNSVNSDGSTKGGRTTLLISGNASEADFRALAAAVSDAK
ncbi:MAG: DUF4245 family protein [Nakamurella sp.]